MENDYGYIDLHSHPVFKIDDGAATIEESITMFRQWDDQGVTKVVATHHYDPVSETVDQFIKRLNNNLQILKTELNNHSLEIEVFTGAEILFRETMVNHDLSKLTIADTNYLLIELPTRTIPINFEEVFSALIAKGYEIILAHVERYPYIISDLSQYERLLNLGVIMQVNASSVIKKDKFIQLGIKRNYIHIISSDAHNTMHRAPNLKEAFSAISYSDAQRLNNNAYKVLNNELISTAPFKRIRQFLGYKF